MASIELAIKREREREREAYRREREGNWADILLLCAVRVAQSHLSLSVAGS